MNDLLEVHFSRVDSRSIRPDIPKRTTNKGLRSTHMLFKRGERWSLTIHAGAHRKQAFSRTWRLLKPQSAESRFQRDRCPAQGQAPDVLRTAVSSQHVRRHGRRLHPQRNAAAKGPWPAWRNGAHVGDVRHNGLITVGSSPADCGRHLRGFRRGPGCRVPRLPLCGHLRPVDRTEVRYRIHAFGILPRLDPLQ